ncbi:MAG: hypothetical protein FWD42_10710 [Solirubrobacterales bacterium]|nr:hypothetical protein [Solirubrobacterales bacterium]
MVFQNGVGPQGEPSATGNNSSTVVELAPGGHPIAQWDVEGHSDGLTADPETGQVIGTVNEDANSSVFTIDPVSGRVVHFSYNEPLPHDGGTDAIAIYHGTILISASAPGTTGPPGSPHPAVYEVKLEGDTHTAVVTPLFSDEATATLANAGGQGVDVGLELTDPDSNEVVPFWAPRFAGDFMLDSQGDQEQVFASDAGRPDQSLSVLKLSTAVDDTAWPLPVGVLYASDSKHDTLVAITGLFRFGSVLVAATPCDANGAPSPCPAPGFPANYLGELNPWTGEITSVPLIGPGVEPKGLLFVR